MKTNTSIERIRHGDYLAEVEVQIHEYPGKECSPTLPLEEVRKIERVRKTLEAGDLNAVMPLAKLYRLEAVEESKHDK